MSTVARAPASVAEPVAPRGRSPWRLALARFAGNRGAVTSAVVLALIVGACLAAPLLAEHVMDTDPFASNVNGTTTIDGREVPVVAPNASGLGSNPIGPTLERRYFLGADGQGRDVMARLLYGGRASLQIALAAALITAVIATTLGLVAGLYGGWVDGLISRVLDLIWAFPVYLLAISLATVLLVQGLEIGPVSIDAGSLWLPSVIIGLIYVPYLARPVRGEALSVRRQEFVEAAEAQGASNPRLLVGELLPNVAPVIIVFLPLIVATNILTESALSYLSIGVQAPGASWGTVILDGQGLLYTRPWVSIAPGILIALTVLTLNVIGDGVRDALDPRGRIRGRRGLLRRGGAV